MQEKKTYKRKNSFKQIQNNSSFDVDELLENVVEQGDLENLKRAIEFGVSPNTRVKGEWPLILLAARVKFRVF